MRINASENDKLAPVNQHIQQRDVSAVSTAFPGSAHRNGNRYTEGQEVFSLSNFGVQDDSRLRKGALFQMVKISRSFYEHSLFFKMHTF